MRDKAKAVMNLVQDRRLLEEERESARKQMSRYVGISSDEYSRGGYSGGPTTAPANITGFGNPNFNSKGQADSRPSAEASYARGYDSNPKYEARETSEPKPTIQLSFFEQRQAPAPEPTKPAAVEPHRPAKPLAPPSFFEPPKAIQQPVQSALLERKPEVPGNIFAPPVVTKQLPAQAKPASEIFLPPVQSLSAAFPAPPQQVFVAAFPPTQATPPVFPTPVQSFPTFPQPTNPTPQYSVPAQPVSYFPVPPTSTPVYAPKPTPQPQPDPRFHIHHNMDAYSGPSLSDLKVTPGLKEEFTDFHTAPGTQSKPADVESMLVNLDNLLVESKKKTDPRHNIGF